MPWSPAGKSLFHLLSFLFIRSYSSNFLQKYLKFYLPNFYPRRVVLFSFCLLGLANLILFAILTYKYMGPPFVSSNKSCLFPLKRRRLDGPRNYRYLPIGTTLYNNAFTAHLSPYCSYYHYTHICIHSNTSLTSGLV